MFTDEQLPLGKLLVIGRSDDGRELAVSIEIDRPEIWQTCIAGLLLALKDSLDASTTMH